MSESSRRAGGSCLGGILGAVVGIILGWFIGHMIMAKPAHDPNLPILSGVFGFFGSMTELLISLCIVGFLGIVGAIGGAMYGSSRAVSHPVVEQDEIAELKRRLAQLESDSTPLASPRGEGESRAE